MALLAAVHHAGAQTPQQPCVPGQTDRFCPPANAPGGGSIPPPDSLAFSTPTPAPNQDGTTVSPVLIIPPTPAPTQSGDAGGRLQPGALTTLPMLLPYQTG